ncbi:tRNA1(Val) (adenine(37)-N6)-methyltransferase [Caldanaerobius polysaccharolyticus]|uniref:tRNA1(Val) (adenine(37)-N6)-methyltransferase n=1 Tax=Caldanaerobius polysaccharolyticus TaxID=44256 RepID=UPI0005500A0B|nr:tRNA1(Val) (adenine(37)-N6)-methyltransferase [Caldanaerobius polysaccharolyticus]
MEQNEVVDDIGYGLKIIQKRKGVKFGIDAVLLSHFVTVKKHDSIADLGTGCGIIPLLLYGIHRGYITVTGIEIQPSYADMAQRSVKLNRLEDHIRIIKGDLKEASRILGSQNFDVVITNPPYRKASDGKISPDDERAIARHEILCTLDDIIKAANTLLKYRGKFAMVHLPERLPEIMCAVKKYSLEPKRMRLVYPYSQSPPSLMLLECIKGGNPQLNILPPLVVYREDGSYTDEILDIYGKS